MGKPAERQGRKAMGLKSRCGQDCQAVVLVEATC